ncbi:MAG: trypsin-like peptidase domain-containing protein [Armatimonadota bacterium]|nr:trypsin-like peptidase domain-containing protein [Armatimonadota bacterium]
MKKVASYVFVFVLGFAACAWILKEWGYTRPENAGLVISQGTRTKQVVQKGLNPIADAAAKVAPAVVNIDTVSEIRMSSPIEEFFGFPAPKSQVRGQGSGVIIRKDGYILTNNHVVEGANKIVVRLADGRRFKGRIIGRDPRSDLAVIKIDANNLPVAVLGDSDNLRVGDWAIAIGNPLGFSNTVTVGVISATKRTDFPLPNGSVLEEVIQTDAAINQGNSGGALANINGEVIGINTAILSETGGNIGLGFAIPINNAKTIVAQLIEKGEVVRPWVGVALQDLGGDLAAWYEQRGFKGNHGVIIAQVVPDSPAAKAGIMQYDIITDVDGKKLRSASEFVKIVAKHKIGDIIRVTIWRDGVTRVVAIRLAKMPAGVQ